MSIRFYKFSFFLSVIFINPLYSQINDKIKLINRTERIVASYYLDNITSYGHQINLEQEDSLSIFSSSELTIFIADAIQTLYILKPGNTYKFIVRNGIVTLECNYVNQNDYRNFHFFENLSLSTLPLRILSAINFVDNDYEHRQPYIDSIYVVRMNYLKDFHNNDNSFNQLAESFINAYYVKESLTFPRDNESEFRNFLNSYSKRLFFFKNKIPLLYKPYYYPLRESAFAYENFVKSLTNEDSIKHYQLSQIDTTAYQFYIVNKLAKAISLSKKIGTLDSLKVVIDSLTLPDTFFEELKKIINDKRNSLIQSTITANRINTKNSSVLSLSKILKSNRKIIYLDLWASWCIPCREELQFSRKIIENFNNKNIDFIFLSMDQSFIKWKSALIDYPKLMNSKNSFFLISNFKSDFSIKHKVSSIPRYMIIGMGGKILDDDAPAPSDSRLIPILNKFLSY